MQSNRVMLLLSLIILMLYLLSTICAHSCYLHTYQDGQMNRIGKRIIMMSIRLVVNQSAYL
jgi:hypothetical protein